MIKETPNPPETDDVSPNESLDSKKLHEAANRALDHYLNPAALKSPATRKPSTMYMVAPDIKDEDLKHYIIRKLNERRMYYEQADVIITKEDAISMNDFIQTVLHA